MARRPVAQSIQKTIITTKASPLAVLVNRILNFRFWRVECIAEVSSFILFYLGEGEKYNGKQENSVANAHFV